MLTLFISWPGVALFSVILLRKNLSLIVTRLIASNDSKAKIGPIEIELGKLAKDGEMAINNLNELNMLIARSRLLELEFAEKSIAPTFSEHQQKELSNIVREMRVKLRQMES